MTPDIETVAARTVYENRWMRVREDAIRRRDGSTGIYGVVERADFVVVAAVAAGRIHLVEQYRYPVQARYWELPQGSREQLAGDDPLQLARAELRQETGLLAATMTHAGRLFLGYGYSVQAYDVFLATGLEAGAPDLEHEEQDLVSRAFTIAELEAMLREGVIRDATTVAAFGLLRLKGLL